jgi:hypothetical protein
MQVQPWAAHFERGQAGAPRSALRARRLALPEHHPAAYRAAPMVAAVAELQRLAELPAAPAVALLPAPVVSFPRRVVCGPAAVLVRRAPHSAWVSDPDAFQVPDPDAFAEHLRPAAGVVREVVLASRVAAARQRQAEAREAAVVPLDASVVRQAVEAVVVPLDASVVRQAVEAVEEAASDVPLLAVVPAVALVSDAPEEPQPAEAAVLDVQEALPPVAEAAVSDARAAEPPEAVRHVVEEPREAVVLHAVVELQEAAARDAAVPPQAAAHRVAQAVVPAAAVPSAAAWVFRQGRLRRPAVAQRPVALSVHWIRRSQTAPQSAWWSQAAQDEVWS